MRFTSSGNCLLEFLIKKSSDWGPPGPSLDPQTTIVAESMCDEAFLWEGLPEWSRLYFSSTEDFSKSLTHTWRSSTSISYRLWLRSAEEEDIILWSILGQDCDWLSKSFSHVFVKRSSMMVIWFNSGVACQAATVRGFAFHNEQTMESSMNKILCNIFHDGDPYLRTTVLFWKSVRVPLERYY